MQAEVAQNLVVSRFIWIVPSSHITCLERGAFANSEWQAAQQLLADDIARCCLHMLSHHMQKAEDWAKGPCIALSQEIRGPGAIFERPSVVGTRSWA